MRECRSLRCAGALDAGLSARAKHANLRRVPRGRLVRTRDRTSRQQSSDPPALTLHRAKEAPVSALGLRRCVLEIDGSRVPPAIAFSFVEHDQLSILAVTLCLILCVLGLRASDSCM